MEIDIGMENEAIESERLDADILQATLEAQGRQIGRAFKKAQIAFNKGDKALAGELCPHGWGYPLNSPAANNYNDPAEGQEGVRCHHCGSRLSAFPWENGYVLVPCEVTGTTIK